MLAQYLGCGLISQPPVGQSLAAMLNNERTYIDSIFNASGKYASWDPEVYDFHQVNEIDPHTYQDSSQRRRLGKNNAGEARFSILAHAQERHILEGGEYFLGRDGRETWDPKPR